MDKSPNAPRGKVIGDDATWPKWRYGPNGQSKVFEKPEDVPMGWEDHPSKVGKNVRPAPVPEPVVLPLTRRELVAGFQQRGVAVDPAATDAELYQMYLDYVDKHEATAAATQDAKPAPQKPKK